ncbi:integrase, catalytic region, zinc finger, CCHC-type containing protein [Tanacetum coccineum]|uniref:Integrase, catalytic region, zinc finger, CCHC-type containing protein n=1 Tax=Tanacetum coccineum TaxID=301880 RepID=A0ABQ5IHX9_9ASTR
MQKNLALLAKYFKRLYKPTNNNLRTSSNSRNKTEDTTPRYNNDNQSGQFGNQRTMTVAGARETVGSQVVQQNGIQCFNCKGFGHYAKECRKPKRVKDYSYHKEKMMMCKQAEQGVPLQAEQADWLADTDEEIDEQELEAHYSFMAKIQEVLPEESSSTEQPLEQVQNNDENNVFANERQHSENNTAECADERAALANLIANLTLDTEENKTILKQLKKANASLTQELEECKTNLDETSRALGEATSCRDSCLIALQNKQNELEKYIAFNDRTIDYDILQTKLNETLGLLARKDIDIKEGLKTKAYEISVVNQKHDELVKRSLLTKSQFEGQLKEKSKVISDLKVKEEKDIDKMIEMDKQLKFLNEIVYTRNQSIQTIHMLAPKCSTYNGRPTFANPRYLKKAQSEKPCLYEIPYDTSDLANRFAPNREETMTLANESRSKLNKDYVKPYDYTRQNSLYEIFKAPSLEYLYQLERAKEVRKTMWRKPFVRTKPNIAKNVAFLPVSKSISKSRQVFNDMTFNINQFREIVDQAWFKHTSDYFRVPTAKDMEVLIKTLLMPLSIKSQNDSFRFEHELKTEMHEDYEYVKSLKKEVDELESEKADFSNIYDLLLEECVSKDVTCSYLHSLSNLNAYAELQCLYLHKVKECECLAQKFSKQTESVNKEVHNKLLKSFAKLENHSISLELALQQCKEQMKNNSVCKENGSNVFRKRTVEQYHGNTGFESSNARQET